MSTTVCISAGKGCVWGDQEGQMTIIALHHRLCCVDFLDFFFWEEKATLRGALDFYEVALKLDFPVQSGL